MQLVIKKTHRKTVSKGGAKCCGMCETANETKRASLNLPIIDLVLIDCEYSLLMELNDGIGQHVAHVNGSALL